MAKVQPCHDPLYEVSEAGIIEAIAGFVGSLLLVGLIVWNVSA
jgi:hypothetical protein